MNEKTNHFNKNDDILCVVSLSGCITRKALCQDGEDNMLSWAIVFLVIALIAAFLGFTGVAGTAAGIAQILFVVFLILFVVSLIFGRRANL